MSQEKELEIRRQFLDEAQEYLDTLDAALMGLADNRVDTGKINAALRAAHSVKGGAGMMGFETLSELAHRLEDSFKVVKNQRQLTLDGEVENLLLSGVNCLRQVILGDRRALLNGAFTPPPPDATWLNQQVYPIFDQLRDRLGTPDADDAASVLSTEDGQDIIPLLFETEVEGCLQRLESVLVSPGQPCLLEEVTILAQELGGLGEMLQLSAFSQLCDDVAHRLSVAPADVATIAAAALQSWRTSQALVMIGQYDQLPTAIAPLAADPAFSGTAPKDIAGDADIIRDFDRDVDSELANELSHELGHELGDQAGAALRTAADYPFAGFEVQESDANRLVGDPDAEGATVDVTAFFEDLQVTQPLVNDAAPRATEFGDRFTSPLPATDFQIADAPADAPTEDEDATVRVSVRQLNQLNDLFGELAIERNGLDLYLQRLRNLTRSLGDRVQRLNQSNAEMRTAYDRGSLRKPLLLPGTGGAAPTTNPISYSESNLGPANSRFDALEMDRYSDLHLLSQDVMETIVQIQEITSDIEISLDDTEQTTRDLNKTSKQLQTNLTKLRMRPLSDVVDRFPRALREMCLQYGKKVNLELKGANTLIDRNILESLSDPLMHLLRNAFDHGMESADSRRTQGKPETGTIEIAASHRSNRTLITIRDDGRGIPLDKIRSRAERMGLDASLLATASDQDLLSLIFEPGFSTSDQITALSGRGVGLDVVRDNLKQVRGEIKVDTQPGQGTTFTLSVPFTLSIVRILLAESNGMLLAFPSDIIEEIGLFKPEAVITTMGSEMINWQGTVAPVVRLGHWLKFNCPRQSHNLETPPTINSAAILLVNSGTETVALQVDRCWGEQEVTVRRAEGSLPMPAGFSTCTILGDGRIVPLVNPAELLRWVTSIERSQAAVVDTAAALNLPAHLLANVPRATTRAKANILIVDDSINVRRFLALTLEQAGYHTEQAKDGQDALEKLQANLPVQAIICDIEMPRLDGFGLLTRLKANPTLRHLPIAMLTSRSGEKHRQLAMNLGATAYFSKPYNEQELLQTLAEMTQELALPRT